MLIQVGWATHPFIQTPRRPPPQVEGQGEGYWQRFSVTSADDQRHVGAYLFQRTDNASAAQVADTS